VLVDARRGRVVGFVNPVEEGAAAAPALSDARARERARATAGQLGYPASTYSVLEVGRKTRPKRLDTTVVLESQPPGVGEARPRLTAVFHGDRLAAFYPSIRVPESFLRAYRKQGLLEPILLGLRIIVIGAFIGVAIVLFIRLVKSQGFSGRRWRTGLLAVALLAVAALANSTNTILRVYPTAIPLPLFLTTVAVGLVLGWILIVCGAGISFVLFEGARPGWRRALRTQGSFGDALLRAAVAALGLLGLERWSRLLAERVPDLFEIQPTLAPPLERAVPALSVLWTGLLFAVAAGVIGSVVALAWREPSFRKTSGRLLVLLGLLVVLAPSSFHSPLGFFGNLIPDLLVIIWFSVAAFALLRDHVAAWVLFAAFVSGGSAVARLLSQSAPADQAAGWMSLALLVIAIAGLLAGGRREPAAAGPVVAAPVALPEIES
jgi:hypothetical protein